MAVHVSSWARLGQKITGLLVIVVMVEAARLQPSCLKPTGCTVPTKRICGCFQENMCMNDRGGMDERLKAGIGYGWMVEGGCT